MSGCDTFVKEGAEEEAASSTSGSGSTGAQNGNGADQEVEPKLEENEEDTSADGEQEEDELLELEADKILGMRDVNENRFVLVKWKNSERVTVFPHEEVEARWPHLLLDFYEELLFHNFCPGMTTLN